jgi:hypothetical protein
VKKKKLREDMIYAVILGTMCHAIILVMTLVAILVFLIAVVVNFYKKKQLYLHDKTAK